MKDFSKYLKDKRRVAAFGEKIGNEVEIFLLYCSKKDQFNKKFAKKTYNDYKLFKDLKILSVNPIIIRIPIEDKNSAEYTFKQYMNFNFYKRIVVFCKKLIKIEYINNKHEFIKINENRGVTKLSI